MAAFGSQVDGRKEVAYEYLCHLEEARKWVESVIKEALPDAQQWEYSLCNGICLCKLGAKLIPDFPVWKKVYDPDENRFKTRGLEYRHTDNINFFLLALKKLGLPKVFHPSTVDVFTSKNIPQVIYCLHALSHFLKAKGSVRVPILDLYGKANFSEEVVSKISVQLEKSKKDLPAFDVVENLVEEELQYESMGLTVDTSDDNAAAHTANGTSDAAGETTPPPVAAPHLSSPKVASVANGSQSSTTTTAPKMDLKSLFDDPSYAELQSMIEDIEKLGQGFDLLLPTLEPTETASESSVAEARSISPPATTAVDLDDGGVASRVSPVVEYTCKDSDVKAAVYSTVDKLKKRKRSNTEIDTTISEVDEAVEYSDPVETVKKLKAAATANKMAYVFTDIKYANLYHEALKREKSFGVPNSAVVIFRGINREKCEKMLEKMSPGAYILRACPDSNTEFVFSYRNQTGIKHWKITPTNGKYTWGNSPEFENIEEFIENFARCLSSATKLKVYPGMTTNLHPEQSEENGVREKLDDSSSERPLTREQINRVIVEVNSTISGLKRAEKPEASPPPLPSKPSRKWTSQNVRKISRSDAESMLEQRGRPGSFLVRPSETEPGGYAIVFRTKEDMKRWKIVTKDSQFMVHPRPQKYPTLEAVVEVFMKGLKDHTGLDMVELDLPEDEAVRSPVAKQPWELSTLAPKQSPTNSKQPSPAPRSVSSSSREVSPFMSSSSSTEEVAYSRLNFSKAKRQDDIPEPPAVTDTQSYSVISRHDSSPTRSLSKLNPHNVTSWSVEDVTQWLISEGLGQFTEEFKENVVDGECLINLDMAQLRDDLSIKALGHRHRLMKKINKLKEDCGLPTS